MISIFKNFTKKKLAGLLLIIVIIIAFGFGGFGGGFNPGNQNNIAKINNTNISTQDFMNYLDSSGLSSNVIKENIDKNILEELLSTLISTTLINLEIKDLNLTMSEKTLIEKIKTNKNFYDENNQFQRTLYEKYLLTNNMTAAMYELKLKNNTFQKQLFTYLSGGAKSPSFLVKKYHEEKNRKLDVNYINLNKFYKKINEFSNQEIQIFVKENSEKLKQDYLDFSYVVITPKILTGSEEYSQIFFDKIDDIENKVAKNIMFKTIINELNIVPVIKKNYFYLENEETIENKIYNYREDLTQILEDNGSYIFYQIDKVNTKLPDLNNNNFKLQIKSLLFQKEKFEFNKTILEKINKNEFDQAAFNKLGVNGISKIKLNSIEDNKKFEKNSIEVLYSLPINTFTLIADEKDNVFVAKIVKYEEQSILEDSKNYNETSNQSSAQNRNGILKTYDYLLNNKYNVVVKQRTLDRVKNYFK